MKEWLAAFWHHLYSLCSIPLLALIALARRKLSTMNWEELLALAFDAFLSKTGSFRLGNYEVTITDSTGAPAHLTLAQAITTAEMVLAGSSGTFQVGEIIVTIAPYTTATPAPSAAATQLAAALAPITNPAATAPPAADDIADAAQKVAAVAKPITDYFARRK